VKKPGRLEITCPRCRFLIFDYPRPCVGTIVIKGDDLLVLRRRHRPKRGFLDYPGGFLEANESLEGGARRELREETGLRLGAMDFLGIYWDQYFLKGFGAFPTLNFYWIGRWRAGEPQAADDAASAEWRPLATLGRRGDRLAWKHMRDALRDARAWASRPAQRVTGSRSIDQRPFRSRRTK